MDPIEKSLADQAVPVFKDLVSRYPANSTYHFHLGMAYKQKGDNGKALDELRDALKHNPPKDEMQQIQDMMSKLGAR